MHQVDISIVVPLYCEAYNVPQLIRDLMSVFKSGEWYEIILVDDGSLDETWSVIRTEASRHEMITAIRLSRNFGKEAAIRAGLTQSSGRAVIIMDGDLQHPPDLIPKMVEIWREGEVDIVGTYRIFGEHDSLLRKLLSKVFYYIFYSFTNYNITNHTDYMLIDRRVVEVLLSLGERHVFIRCQIPWLGFKQVKLPFVAKLRKHGQTSWSTGALLHSSLKAILTYSLVPLRTIAAIGIALLCFAIIYGIFIFTRSCLGHVVNDVQILATIVFFIGGLNMVSMGIIAEYILMMFNEIQSRPHFIIKELIKGNSSKSSSGDSF